MPPAITCIGRCAATARPWRHGGGGRLTVIVKVTLEIVPGGIMRLANPEAVATADVVRGGAPLGTLRQHDETALDQRRVDVTMDAEIAPMDPPGEAYARLAAGVGDEGRVDKTVVARVGAAPVPICFENAFGGPHHHENPVGRGDPVVRLASGEGIGCFSPIPAAFPVRGARLTREDDLARAVAAIPVAFDWTYFQAAPPDQQMDPPGIGERLWVVMEGVHPAHPRIETRLPDLAVEAHARWATAWLSPPLRLGNLHLEPRRLRAWAVYRGVIDLGDLDLDDADAAVSIVASCRPAEALSPSGALGETMVLADDRPTAETPSMMAPSSMTSPPSTMGPPSTREPRADAAPDAVPPSLDGTFVMTSVPARPALPFAPATSTGPRLEPKAPAARSPGARWLTPPPPPDRTSAEHPFERTVLAPHVASAPPLPFLPERPPPPDGAPGVTPRPETSTPPATAAASPNAEGSPEAEARRAAAELSRAREEEARRSEARRREEAARAAREEAAREAEARRAAEAERFRAEERAAREREAEAARKAERERDEAARELRTSLYASLGRKRGS